MDRSKLDHLPFFDVSFMFGASKSTHFRARILMSAQAIAEVLAERKLAKVDLRPRYFDSPETFLVNIGDLTDGALHSPKITIVGGSLARTAGRNHSRMTNIDPRLSGRWKSFATNSRGMELKRHNLSLEHTSCRVLSYSRYVSR